MSMVSNTPRQISTVNFSHQRSCFPVNDAKRLRFGNVIGCTRTHVGNLRVAVNSSTNSREVIVVGGGAAGLTAAYFAAKNGAKVTILEGTPEAGKKILISGGKRCNVVPGDVELERDYITESSNSALRSIFSRWDLYSCIEWLEEEIGLKLAFDEETNKYFPESNSAKQVRDQLLQACTRHGVSLRYGSKLAGLKSDASGWLCTTENGKEHHAARVIMATGGMSFPHLGTDGKGFKILKALGHNYHQPYPALTPLKGTHVASSQLAGLSMYNVLLSAQLPGKSGKNVRKKGPIAERSAMLFTHRGFSGPAILDLSHHFVRAKERGLETPALQINWMSSSREEWQERFQDQGLMKVDSLLRAHGLPARLSQALMEEVGVVDKPISQVKKEDKRMLLDALIAYNLHLSGHEGYPKAEVTGGGVRLEDLDCATLESRSCEGLFMCGELLDVFGRIGGFNFYWAWLSGRVAGMAASQPP